MDGNANNLRKLANRLARSLKKFGGKKSTIKQLQSGASQNYEVAWTATWKNPSKSQTCQFAEACVLISNANNLSDYSAAVQSLKNLIDSAAKQLKKLKGGNSIGQKYLSQAKTALANANASAAAIPAQSQVCP